MKLPPIQIKTVLITGCSSGIGASTAELLRDNGWTVIPTARKVEDLDRLRDQGFEPVSLDVSNADSVANAVEETLKRTQGQLGALVNNAGYGQAGALEDLSRDVLRYQFEVNLIGMQDITNRCIPIFRKQGYGRIVNISSVLGRVTLPFYGSYSASKHAMESFSDAMRVELYGSGIGVILIEPGPIITAFRKNAADHAAKSLTIEEATHGAFYQKEIDRRKKQSKKVGFINRPPEDVALKIQRALESRSPKRRYCVTIPAYLGSWMRRFAPDALMDWVYIRRLPKNR